MPRTGATPVNFGKPKKNWLINGGMDFWQRGTSFTGVHEYTADRWFRFTQGGLGLASMRTELIENAAIEIDPGAVTNRAMRWGRLNGTTQTAQTELVQALETRDSTNLSGRWITFSFFARCGVDHPGTMNFYFSSGEGLDEGVIASWTNELVLVPGTVFNLTTNFERYYISAFVPQTKTQIRVNMNYVPVGTAGANEYIDISALKLEVGNVPSAFSRSGETYIQEFKLCQRYYANMLLPGFFGRVNTDAGGNPIGAFDVQFPVTMRGLPIVTDQLERNDVPGFNCPVQSVTTQVWSAFPPVSIGAYWDLVGLQADAEL